MRNVATSLTGTVVAQAITLGTMMVLTRVYHPEAFALAQSVTAILAVLSMAASLRYDLALASAEKTDLSNLALLAMGILLVSCLLTALLAPDLTALGLGRTVAGFSGALRWALPASLLLTVVANGATHLLIREDRFRQIAGSKVWQAVGGGVVAMTVAFGFHTGSGVLIADVAGRLVLALLLAWALSKARLLPKPKVNGADLRNVARRYSRYPLMGVPGGVLNALGGSFNTIWMLALFSAHSAGSYALVERVLSAPMALVATAFAQAYQGRLIRHIDGGEAGATADFMSLLRLQAAAGIIIAAILFVVAPWGFPFVFGGQWREAGRFAQIIGVNVAAATVTFPFNISLVLLGRQSLQLTWEIVRFVLLNGAWAVAYACRLDPAVALSIVTLAGIISNGLFLVMVHKQLQIRDAALEAA